MHMSDTVSEAGSRRSYNMTAAAANQRSDLADRRRWFKDMADLRYKLGLKQDGSRLLAEIEDVLLKVLSFSDMVDLFPKAYDEF